MATPFATETIATAFVDDNAVVNCKNNNDSNSDDEDENWKWTARLFAPDHDDDDSNDDGLISRHIWSLPSAEETAQHVSWMHHPKGNESIAMEKGNSLLTQELLSWWQSSSQLHSQNQFLQIPYHLAFLATGHGDSVWNASLCLAAHLVHFQGFWLGGCHSDNDHHDDNGAASKQGEETSDNNQVHGSAEANVKHHNATPSSASPCIYLELGAGAALPSLALLWRDSHKMQQDEEEKENQPTIVVITDRFQADNFRALEQSVRVITECDADDIRKCRTRIVPHSWGHPEELHAIQHETLPALLQGDASVGSPPTPTNQPPPKCHVDVLLTADCIYMPEYHGALVASATALLRPGSGRWMVAYSYHPNVPRAAVHQFFEHCTRAGFFALHQFTQDYPEGQAGIGSPDPERGRVYVQILQKLHVDC